MARGAHRRNDARPSWDRYRSPPAPISMRLGQPTDLPYGRSSQGFLPAVHPDDPTRLEHQPPWAPEDPRESRNADEGLPASRWGDYSLTAPEARPGQFQDFFQHSGPVSLTAGTRTQVLSYIAPAEEEGRLLELAAQSTELAELALGNLGFDITWELLLNGSGLPGRAAFTGFFAPLARPLRLIVQFARAARLELYATSPVPRQVQAFFHGWTSPLVRGFGRASSGIERP